MGIFYSSLYFFRNDKIALADTSSCEVNSDNLNPYCLETQIEKQLNCKIPWANTTTVCKYSFEIPLVLLIEIIHTQVFFLYLVKYCTGSKDLLGIFSKLPDDTSTRSTLHTYFQHIGCKKSCTYNNYKPM